MRDAVPNRVDPLPVLPPEVLDDLGAAMDACGVGVLSSVVAPGLLAEMSDYIHQELAHRGGQYFSMEGPQWIADSPLAPLARSAGLQRVLGSLWEHAMHTRVPQNALAPSLRVLSGTVGLKHSFLFHYDSYVVTALIPLLIPDGQDEPHGDLVLFPNLRPVRRNALFNICEKALVENALACRFWRMPWVQRRLQARVVPMKPGHIYFFWGMRCLHANQPCLPGSVRSTALFHFGDPHAGGFLKRLSAAHHRAKVRRLDRAARKRRAAL
jgi:hypothetical protein